MLRAYALLIGAGLIVLGLTGFSVVPSNVLTFPENALHLAVGLLFCSGVLLLGTNPGPPLSLIDADSGNNGACGL